MGSKTRLLIPAAAVILIVIAALIYLNHAGREDVDQAENERIDEAGEKGRSPREQGEIEDHAAGESDLSERITISGKLVLEGDVSSIPELDTIDVELKLLSGPEKVVQVQKCNVPGDFSFDGVGQGEYVIHAVTSGKWSARSPYVRAEGTDISGLVLELRERGQYTGMVLDYESRPVEGAEVLICFWSGYVYSPSLFDEAVRRKQGMVVKTDSKGRFSGVSPDSHSHIFARKEGYTVAQTCGGRGGDDEVLRMGMESIISGTVADPDGRIVPGALVVISPDTKSPSSGPGMSDGAGSYVVMSDEIGIFSLNGLHGGSYRILAWSSDKQMSGTMKCKVKSEEATNIGPETLPPPATDPCRRR